MSNEKILTAYGLIETLQELLTEEERAMPIAFLAEMDGSYALPGPMTRKMVSVAHYCDKHGRLLPDYLFSGEAQDPGDPEDWPLNRADYIRLNQPILCIDFEETTTVPTEG